MCQAVTPNPGHELPIKYGALDLYYVGVPHEQIHSTSSVDRPAELTKPITDVTTMPIITATPGIFSWSGVKGTVTTSTAGG